MVEQFNQNLYYDNLNVKTKYDLPAYVKKIDRENIYSSKDFDGKHDKMIRIELTDKDIAFFTYYFGKSNNIVFQNGKNALNAKSLKITKLNSIIYNSDAYILNASKLEDESKVSLSERKKVTELVKSDYVMLFDEDGVIHNENYLLNQEVIKKDKKVKKEYLDTTQKNIKAVPGLVIDIDNHSSNLPFEHYVWLANSLDFFLKENYNLPANFINFTGRGLQLFYSVNEFYPKHNNIKALASDTLNLLKNLVKKVLFELQEENKSLKVFNVDDSIQVHRQLVRCPGTINYKSGLKAACLIANTNIERYGLGELINEIKHQLNVKSSNRKFVPFVKTKKFSINQVKMKDNLLNARIHDDILLLKFRGKGSRNTCYTNMCTSLFGLGYTQNEACIFLSEIDKTIEYPYFKDFKDVQTKVKHWYAVCDRKKDKTGIYRITNQVIEKKWYSITPEEYATLPFKTYKNNNSKYHVSLENKKIRKEIKDLILDQYIQDMFTLGKSNISAISKKFNRSRNTIYKYIKDNATYIQETLNQLVKSTKNKVKDKISLIKVAKLFLKDTKQNILDIVEKVVHSHPVQKQHHAVIDNLNKEKMNTLCLRILNKHELRSLLTKRRSLA